jgi:DNA polymerase V
VAHDHQSLSTHEDAMPLHVTAIFTPDQTTAVPCPVFLTAVPAGFPSPADDFLEGSLDLNQHLIRHPAATFFVRVSGDSMIEAGIHSGDLLIVDRALEPAQNHVVIAVVNGELTVKRLGKRGDTLCLLSENGQYPPLLLDATTDCEIWGVVTYVIHRV